MPGCADDQLIVPESDDEDTTTIASKYKRTIEEIMRKGQAKKMKME